MKMSRHLSRQAGRRARETAMAPNYVAPLLAHLYDRLPLPPGCIHHVEARHDDDCAFWTGGRCDCEPIIESGARIDAKYHRKLGVDL